MRVRLRAAVLGILVAATAAGAAPIYAPESLAQWFRLEWTTTPSAKGPVLSGYVYNQTSRRAERMRLSIDGLDAKGHVVAHTTTWVLGGVPPNNRTYFETPVPAAPVYRVTVLSFDWVESDDHRFRRW